MTKTDNTRPAGMLGSEQRDGHQSVSDDHFALTIDFTSYDHKPQGKEIAAITRRLQAAGPTELDAEALALAIAHGCTWCGGCFEPDASAKFGASRFLGLRVYALDFDNDTEALDEGGNPVRDAAGHVVKRPLMPYEAHYCDPWDAAYRFRDTFGTWPLVLYPSMSFKFDGTVRGRFTPEARMKFRLVYDLGRTVTDDGAASKTIARVLWAFPEADQKCQNLNRLFFGASGKCVWYDRDGGAHYVNA
jgi:hypothetical protein